MGQNTVKERQQSRELAAHNKADNFAKLLESSSGLYLEATNTGNISVSLKTAVALQRVRDAFDGEILAMVKPLMNTPLGFMTDRDPNKIDRKTGRPYEPYPDNIIRDCCIEAGLRGFQYTGNQFNIIAERFYPARAGWEYKIKKHLKNLIWIRHDCKPPKVHKDQKGNTIGAFVECSAQWRIGTKEDGMETTIAVKADNWTGPDGMIGKAESKLFKRLYQTLTGIIVLEDEEPGDVFENEATQDERQPDAKAEKGSVQQSDVPGDGAQEKVD